MHDKKKNADEMVQFELELHLPYLVGYKQLKKKYAKITYYHLLL